MPFPTELFLLINTSLKHPKWEREHYTIKYLTKISLWQERMSHYWPEHVQFTIVFLQWPEVSPISFPIFLPLFSYKYNKVFLQLFYCLAEGKTWLIY